MALAAELAELFQRIAEIWLAMPYGVKLCFYFSLGVSIFLIFLSFVSR